MTEDDEKSARFGSLKLLKVCLPWRGIEEDDGELRGQRGFARQGFHKRIKRLAKNQGKLNGARYPNNQFKRLVISAR